MTFLLIWPVNAPSANQHFFAKADLHRPTEQRSIFYIFSPQGAFLALRAKNNFGNLQK